MQLCVYNGLGASQECIYMLLQSLKNLPYPTVQVRDVSHEYFQQDNWHRSTSLVALGGGYDLGYIKSLGNNGLQSIRKYVENGGSYLGVCAGAYLACELIEFDKGGDLEVCGERSLKFFKGRCVGPTFPGFHYNSNAGVHAADIEWVFGDDCQTFSCYFNGGGSLVPFNKDDGDIGTPGSYDVLAIYSQTREPAIVRCTVGEGVAILMGVHMEYIPEQLHGLPGALVKKLTESSPTREHYFRKILEMLL